MSARVLLAGLLLSGCTVTTPVSVPVVESPVPTVTMEGPAEPVADTGTSTGPSGCVLTGSVVVVELDPFKHSDILDHIADAVDAGHPAVLTIARDGADERREDATDDYPTEDGMDRDEYPVAMSAEGGEDSSVWYIDSGQNRSAGAVMGDQLEPYCDGQRFKIGVER